MSKQIRLAAPLQFDSIVDGPGLRVVLWTQGCPHGCPGCHNPETWDAKAGELYDVDALVKAIKANQLQEGLTLSGGEPFDQADALIDIVRQVRNESFNVWAYSGYTYEQLLATESKYDLLKEIDVLVDGKFIQSLCAYTLLYKGSSNQRIIDVQASLKANEIVLWKDPYIINI
ncbi:anaerobic ribonucleoside-triphosphate reductase activating protein [Breznakia blatticola]|uniref:Anaerobic ribonucleoside-triphosphate reductase-activating protein n=1 Tax=Breznakia blatticola TaxID=1754012 RepID=A0A4R7ZCJ1_9FIRM|nr:anaerobic ribonucleoside-triphosphate reductase activating protein [Breznakia blatticola]TDW14556.1 anaerobic ribonucleoside-triphosphate reductase activating protein [Breznakia blatticola]